MPREVTPAAQELIKRFEGWAHAPSLRHLAYPYLCPAAIWTIGWGSTMALDGRPVTRDTPPVTPEEGEALVARDMARFSNATAAMLRVQVTDNQFGALVSFVFNLGPGRLRSSTLLALLNRGDAAGAADQFGRWVMGGGRRLPGLVARREAERELFLRPAARLVVDNTPAQPRGVAALLASFRAAYQGRAA